MASMALILIAALLFGVTALCVLLWAISSGQYEDPDGDAARILLDND
jgi:cbb3-type cytochrome oxidase maturation protein